MSKSFIGETPHTRIEPLLETLLKAIARDRGADVCLEDLSAAVVETARGQLLEAYRLGTEHGEITAVHELPVIGGG